jgi:hypothetical protein
LLGSRQVVKALVFGAGIGGSNPSFPGRQSMVVGCLFLYGVLVLVTQNTV